MVKIIKSFLFLRAEESCIITVFTDTKKVIKAIYQALGKTNSAISCKESGLLFVLAEMDQR